MSELSVRQLSEKLGVSHTQINKTLKELEVKFGTVIGKSGGKGRPKLLSESEQIMVAEELNRVELLVPPVEEVKADVEVLDITSRYGGAIQLASASSLSTLEDIYAEFVEEEVDALAPISLNGSQESLLGGLAEVAHLAKELESANRQLAADLAVRKATNETAKKVMQGVAGKVEKTVKQRRELGKESELVLQDEAEIAQDMAVLQRLLGKP